MELAIAYFGKGRVGSLCREVLDRLGVVILEPVDYHKADLWVSVHWPRIFSREQLVIPKLGCVNLHNSYLPWNRGAHACTWAIVDKTPAGATMHWLDEGVDTGDILFQERLEVQDGETADQLYQRTMGAEVRVFKAGMEMLLSGNHQRVKQPPGGSMHFKRDFDRLMRAMTTNDCKVSREA